MSLILSGTDGLSDVDGSASTPAIRGTDTNTGIFFPAADTIAFAEGGAEVARFDSSGRLGINTSSPSAPLDVQANTSALGIRVRGRASGDGGNIAFFSNDNATEQLSIFSSSGENAFFGTGSRFTSFSTNSTERMRITSAGDMSMGGVPASPPTVSNDIFSGGLYLNPTRRTTGNSGNTFWDTGGAFFRSTSSIKYKTDVNDATYGLSDVLKLRPVTYKGKSELDGDKIFGGFIAEEIDALGLKEFVVYDQDNQPDALAYANMVSLLTKAIQEQQAIITDLKARLEVLETK